MTYQEFTFSREDAGKIQKALGNRPGKTYQPEYLRQSGFSGKYMFWDEEVNKWVHVHRGMRFRITDHGPRLVPAL